MAQVNEFPLGEIVVTTLWHRSKWIADNVTTSNALLRKLSEAGKIKTVSGGRQIVQELEYAENDTFLWYTGDDQLTVAASTPVIDAALYDWKQAAVVVRANGLEVNVQNTGKEAVLNLLEARINNAAKTMANQIGTALYSDGTTNAKMIEGLQLQVADAPATGVVGGINRATAGNEWWRNQASGATDIAADTIEAYMQNLYMLCTRGSDVPDLILADAIFYQAFWTSLMAIQRIQQVDEGQRGWPTLKFVNADVIYDGDTGIPASHMYFLNTDYLYWRPHADVNMVPDDKRLAYDYDAFVIPILFAGNLTMSNAMLQGVLFDSTP